MSIQNSYCGKKVTITGASGYLGSAIVKHLLKIEANIIRVSRKKLQELDDVSDLVGDIYEKDLWLDVVKNSDVIIHLAGNTSVYAEKKDLILGINSTLIPVINLIEAAKIAGNTPLVLFSSTASVYGLNPTVPTAEKERENPITSYDIHKLCAEKHLQIAHEDGIIRNVNLRLSNVYGPSISKSSSSDRGILNYFARKATAGEPIIVYGDGSSIRDYIFIDDVVKAFILAGLIDISKHSLFNVGSGIGFTIKEVFTRLATRASEISGKHVELKFVPWPESADLIEHRNYIADISLIKKVLNWRPEVGLDTGIDLTLRSFYKNCRESKS